MPTEVTAQERYAEHLTSIGERLTNLLDWNLRAQETIEDAPRDWRDVGDAAHIDDLLAMACEFLEMEPETPHPNHAGTKCTVYLSPERLETALRLGNQDVQNGIGNALDWCDADYRLSEEQRINEYEMWRGPRPGPFA